MSTNEPSKLGRYEIVGELGKGAMGVVYEGNDPNIGRRVAIKTARRDVLEASGMAEEMMERFLREAKAAGALNHPNIITIFDADEQDGMAYIAMEFLEGGDLKRVLEVRSKLDISDIVDIGATVCEALAVAHAQGIVHRDIKPANILMPDNAPLKVADFGIAHVSDSNLTQDGAMIGTPHYMSPEQFMGQKLDGRSDQYSVGIILYELLTGEKPFTGEALSTVMHHCLKTVPVPPKELNFAVGDTLNQVVMKMLAKGPQERYADANATAAALRESIKENPDPAILGLALPSADATLQAASPPVEAGATMAMSAPPAGVTEGGAAPVEETTLAQQPPQGTTVNKSPADQAEDATAVRPEGEATTLAPAADEATRVAPAPTPTATPEPAPTSKTPMLIGVAVVALVAIIGGMMALGGGGGDGATEAGNAPNSETQGNTLAPGEVNTASNGNEAAGDYAIEKLQVRIFQAVEALPTDTPRIYVGDLAELNTQAFQEIGGTCTFFEDGRILLDAFDIDAFGGSMAKFAENGLTPKSLEVLAESGELKTEQLAVNFKATKDKATTQIGIIVE